MGGPKGWGPKKKVANVEIYVIFEVFAFCGGRTKTVFKDWAWVGSLETFSGEAQLKKSPCRKEAIEKMKNNLVKLVKTRFS